MKVEDSTSLVEIVGSTEHPTGASLVTLSNSHKCTLCSREFKTFHGKMKHVCEVKLTCGLCKKSYSQRKGHDCIEQRLEALRTTELTPDEAKTCVACGQWHASVKNINGFRRYHGVSLCADCYHIPEIYKETQSTWKRLCTFLVQSNQYRCYFCEEDCICSNTHQRLKRFEFDHLVPGLKEANIGQMVLEGVQWETILKELTQCRLLCVRCHSFVTFVQRNVGLTNKVDSSSYISFLPEMDKMVRSLLFMQQTPVIGKRKSLIP